MKTLAALVNEDALLRGLMKTLASLANEVGASRLIWSNNGWIQLPCFRAFFHCFAVFNEEINITRILEQAVLSVL